MRQVHWWPGVCFTNVSRHLQNNLARICNARNHIDGENFNLKLCTSAKSMGTLSQFQFGMLTIYVISAIHTFWENSLESSRNASETPQVLWRHLGQQVVLRHVLLPNNFSSCNLELWYFKLKPLQNTLLSAYKPLLHNCTKSFSTKKCLWIVSIFFRSRKTNLSTTIAAWAHPWTMICTSIWWCDKHGIFEEGLCGVIVIIAHLSNERLGQLRSNSNLSTLNITLTYLTLRIC